MAYALLKQLFFTLSCWGHACDNVAKILPVQVNQGGKKTFALSRKPCLACACSLKGNNMGYVRYVEISGSDRPNWLVFLAAPRKK